MKKSTELKESYEQKLSEMDTMLKALEADETKSDFDAVQRKVYDTLATEVSQLEKDIDVAIEREAVQKKAAEMRQPKKNDKRDASSPEDKAVRSFSYMNAIRSQLPTNSGLYKPLDGIEKEMHQEAEREAKLDSRSIEGAGVPSFFLRLNARDHRDIAARGLTSQTTTTGGHTIETSVGNLIPYLEPKLILDRMGMTTLSGLVGNLDLPRNDAQGTGAWEGEGDDNAEMQPTFDKVSLSPKRYGGYIFANKQLLLQSSMGVESWMRRRIEMNIAQALDVAGINGPGSGGAPTGLLGISGVGTETAGAPTWAKVVGLETDIATANADMGRLGYLTTPAVRGLMKVTPKETGQPIYLWNGGGAGSGEGEVNGYRALTSTLVPSNLGGGTDQHALIFGNWEELVMGQWGGLDIVVDPYSLSKKAQIQIVANVWVDFDVFHPASFSYQLVSLS